MINFNTYTYDMTNQLFRHSEAKEMSVFLARWTPMASIPPEKASKPVNDRKYWFHFRLYELGFA